MNDTKPLHHLPSARPAAKRWCAFNDSVPIVASGLLQRLADPVQGAPGAIAFLSTHAIQRGPGWTQQSLSLLLDWLAEPYIASLPCSQNASSSQATDPIRSGIKHEATGSFSHNPGGAHAGCLAVSSCTLTGRRHPPRALAFPQLLQLQLRRLLVALPHFPKLYDVLDEHCRQVRTELLAVLVQGVGASSDAVRSERSGAGFFEEATSGRRLSCVTAWIRSVMAVSRLRHQRRPDIQPPPPLSLPCHDATTGESSPGAGRYPNGNNTACNVTRDANCAATAEAGDADGGWWWIEGFHSNPSLVSSNARDICFPTITAGDCFEDVDCLKVQDMNVGAEVDLLNTVAVPPDTPGGNSGERRGKSGAKQVVLRRVQQPNMSSRREGTAGFSMDTEVKEAAPAYVGDAVGDGVEGEDAGEAAAGQEEYWQLVQEQQEPSASRATAQCRVFHADAGAALRHCAEATFPTLPPAKRHRTDTTAEQADRVAVAVGSGAAVAATLSADEAVTAVERLVVADVTAAGTGSSVCQADILIALQEAVRGSGGGAGRGPPTELETWCQLETLLERCAAGDNALPTDPSGDVVTTLPADSVLYIVRHLLTLRLSGAAARLLLNLVVFPLVVAVERVIARPLQEALTATGAVHPRPLVESVLVPAVQRPQLTAGQAQLLLKVAGSALPRPLRGLVLRAAASVAPVWGEPHLAVVQGLVDRAGLGPEGLDEETLELLCQGLCSAVIGAEQQLGLQRPLPTLSRNVPLCRLLLSLVSKYGSTLGIVQLRHLATAAAATNTFMTKPCQDKLRVLMQGSGLSG